MISVSKRTLNIIAACIWFIGATILLIKSVVLIERAEVIKPEKIWIFVPVLLSLVFGSVKAKFVIRKSCNRNLKRIASLNEPKLYQFYSPAFFLLVLIMIAAGVTLGRFANNNFAFLISAATLDLSIAFALFGGVYFYWQQKAFARESNS